LIAYGISPDEEAVFLLRINKDWVLLEAILLGVRKGTVWPKRKFPRPLQSLYPSPEPEEFTFWD
jgi:hypothetical protein